jgi:uncharacterized phage protein (TIGR02218 family)
MFKGRVGQLDSVGRAKAVVTVNSDLAMIDIDMPRNVYSPNCIHVFCDSGCGLPIGTFSATGTVGAGSSVNYIPWGSSTSNYTQGTVTFTSGANTGVKATVKYADSSGLTLMYPLPSAPSGGDAFTAAQGCAHTKTACSGYNNISNFRGYPYVPPPEIMTGPLSTTHTTGGK